MTCGARMNVGHIVGTLALEVEEYLRNSDESSSLLKLDWKSEHYLFN